MDTLTALRTDKLSAGNLTYNFISYLPIFLIFGVMFYIIGLLALKDCTA